MFGESVRRINTWKIGGLEDTALSSTQGAKCSSTETRDTIAQQCVEKLCDV